MAAVLPPENTTFIADGAKDFYVSTTVSARHSVAHIAGQFALALEEAIRHAATLRAAAAAGATDAAATVAFIEAHLDVFADKKRGTDTANAFRVVAGALPE